MKLVTVEEMRRIEQEADRTGHSFAAMMELAGAGVARVALQTGAAASGKFALVLAGPGNNGGDGLVAAHHLALAGCSVSVYLWNREVVDDANLRRLSHDHPDIKLMRDDEDPELAGLRAEVARASLVVDALLGTGKARPIKGRLAAILAAVREGVGADEQPFAARTDPSASPARFPMVEASQLRNAPSEAQPPVARKQVVAVDCPTGLNCDTGALDPSALGADATVTFACPKWGHVQYPGAGACGRLAVMDIGIPTDLLEPIRVEIPDLELVRSWLPDRPQGAHKGTFGRAMIVAGSSYYTGAAHLSARAATRAGAGLVTLAVPDILQPALAGALPEVTWLPLPSTSGTHCPDGVAPLVHGLPGFDALLVGPGLTSHAGARGFLTELLSPRGLELEAWRNRLVFDADALNILAAMPDWPDRLPACAILTPHPGEMARLSGFSVQEVNAQRIEFARAQARGWGHIVVLKGPHTVIAAPDGRTAVLPFATAALATAGSGDVLAGVIVALLAQGLAPYEAAVAGAYLHGVAGTTAAAPTAGSGVIAGDIAAAIGASIATVRGLQPAG